jgi:hypothetical protein
VNVAKKRSGIRSYFVGDTVHYKDFGRMREGIEETNRRVGESQRIGKGISMKS